MSQTRPGLMLRSVTLILLAFLAGKASAAGTILAPGDSNSRITVENAITRGNQTTVLFYTWPDRGDPGSGKSCAINFYSLTLSPGLPKAKAEIVAKNVCSGLLLKGALLGNGDARMIVGDRVEQWRGGEQISSEKFSAIDSMAGFSVSSSQMGGQLYDILPSGEMVLAIAAGGFKERDFPGASLVMTNLKPDGALRWTVKFSEAAQQFNVERVWAARDGGALLYAAAHSVDGMMPQSENRLYLITADGKKEMISLMKMEEPFDLSSIRPGSQEDLDRFYAHQRNANPESIKTLGASAREGGGFDVLFHRKGGARGREGHFLYRLGADGKLQSEIALGNHIVEHGLEKWTDFQVSGRELVLLSKVLATQHGVQAKRKKWMQSAVSQIDFNTGVPLSRLIPLDQRYLEAALNAGDAELQYLEGMPGGEPVLLSTLGDKPLVVSVGWIAQRQVLRLNEADDQLAAYTEAFDEKQARLAKEASRQQRKADREFRKQGMQAAQAEAAGMTLEEFNALSKSEQKEALVRSGNIDQLIEAATKEAGAVQAQHAAQQNSPAQPSAQDAHAQIAAAMAEAQQQMENNPHMTPQMRAQMAAVMAQMSGGQRAAAPAPTAPQAAPASAEAVPQNALELDSAMRGFIEYENPDGRLMTLLIFDRKSGKELLKKDYPDGVIYEYVDFSRFGLPPDQIGVLYREVSGMVVKNLTPVIAQ